MDSAKRTTKNCPDCGHQFKYEAAIYNGRELLAGRSCPQCSDAREQKFNAREHERVQAERRAEFARTMPSAFHRTIREQLPNPRLFDVTMEWEFGPIGLLFSGAPRTGKSRVMWEVAKREFLAGRSVLAVDQSFGPDIVALLNRGARFHQQRIRELCKVNLLLMDDVTHAELTPRVEEALFRIIDTRTKWERPTFLTMNETGETLAKLINQAHSTRGTALVGRLREFFQSITSDGIVSRPRPAPQGTTGGAP